jgi:hypothetical protein
MRYEASEKHLTQSLIAFRNLESDNREREGDKITAEVATYDFKSRQKEIGFSFFVQCFQYPSMLPDNCQKNTIVVVAVTKRY